MQGWGLVPADAPLHQRQRSTDQQHKYHGHAAASTGCSARFGLGFVDNDPTIQTELTDKLPDHVGGFDWNKRKERAVVATNNREQLDFDVISAARPSRHVVVGGDV